MSLQTSEFELHQNQLGTYLTSPTNAGGLGWLPGRPEQVDPETLLIREDLLGFLKNGTERNARHWERLVRESGGEEKAWQVVKDSVAEAQNTTPVTLNLLQKGIKIGGLDFSLWNPPMTRGSLHSKRKAFSRNCLRMTNEVSMRPGKGLARKVLTRRPDQMFHVNGLFYSLIEVKARQKGQSAETEGRLKIISDYRQFVTESLMGARARWAVEKAGEPWPGYGTKRMPAGWMHDIRAGVPAFERAAWTATVDGGSVWVMPSFDGFLKLCDECIERGEDPLQSEGLKRALLRVFTRMPELPKMSAREQVKTHLAGLLSPVTGVAQEVALFHHLRKDKVTQRQDILRPRNPQRVIMQQFHHRVDELYGLEWDPGWQEKALRHQIRQTLPQIAETDVHRMVAERLEYRNGQEAYSILFQGAAGLGKTNLAVWMASSLFDRLAPLRPGQAPDTVRTPLFDRVIILTDRTELRDNIAQEAERTSGTRGQVLNADTKEELKAALTGGATAKTTRNGAGIIVVNLQKFPHLMRELVEEGLPIVHNTGRTAFIIDEVHRSQSGALHEDATAPFMDSIGTLAASRHPDVRNLIVGLTATPSEPILARFGEWHVPTSVVDPIKWTPYFSYTPQQAIRDGYILDAKERVVPYTVELLWDRAGASQAVQQGHGKATTSADHIYEDAGRQALVAQKFCEIFAEVTMKAIPNPTRPTGSGKAMITVPSIKAALGMKKAVKKSLLDLADNAKGKPWEGYAEVMREVAEKRLFVLYSDVSSNQSGKPPACASQNGGLDEVQVINGFRCVNAGSDLSARNAIIIVVDKLLTGFDEPTVHTLLIDRSLSGIGLFQAMCRVNRIHPGKSDTLIIDTSENQQVTRAHGKVFAAYGHLASSDLDGKKLVDRIDERRLDILKAASMETCWKLWKATRRDNEAAFTTLSETLNNTAEALMAKDPDAASLLRRLIGGYLSLQKVANIVMVLEAYHTNHQGWLDFLREMHAMLRTGARESLDSVEIGFEAIGISLDPLTDEPSAEPRKNREKGPLRVVDAIADDLIEEEEAMELLDGKILSLQMIEERKRARCEEVRVFLEKLHQKMDNASLLDNHDAFRKDILNGSFYQKDIDQQTRAFRRIQNKAADMAFRREGNHQKLLTISDRWPELMIKFYRERVASAAQTAISA